MDKQRFLACLAADYARLRETVAGALDAPVPSCPGWTGADLANHVAEVYLHKTEAMRAGAEPTEWPPDLAGEPPLDLLDRAYRDLVAELAARDPAERTGTWYTPDQTVGFWVRRMAQETVIHRVDAELAAAVEHAPIPDDLAEDGTDELLVSFLTFATSDYPDMFGDQVTACDGATVRVDTGTSRLLALGPEVVTVDQGHADTDAVIRGEAGTVLRWLWRRTGDDAVTIEGNQSVVARLRALLGTTTQ